MSKNWLDSPREQTKSIVSYDDEGHLLSNDSWLFELF